MTDEDRLFELLVDKLERPLTADERAEMERLLPANPSLKRHDLDFAAAAIDQALAPRPEAIPEHVKARLVARMLGEAKPQLALAPRDDATKPDIDARAVQQDAPKVRRLFVVAPWLAAAAAIALAVAGWWDDVAPKRVAAVDAPDAIRVAWSTTEDPLGKAVAGEVVWSASAQTGTMTFRGLPANDPKTAQYQLWIFDAERDERFPVDGGVFDVVPDGETVVRIAPRVPVGKVTLFAVTLERPGGVVVSTRERLVAVGKV